jgi:hypothetical protein
MQEVIEMKTLAFITTICILLVIGCSTKKESTIVSGSLSGFNQIPWGTSPAVAKLKLLEKEGVKFVSDSSGMRFSGGMFMGYPVKEWILDFSRGTSFWLIRIHFQHDSANSDSNYHNLIRQYESQLGKSKEVIQDGYPKMCIWRFAVSGTEKTNTVGPSLMPSGDVEVWYMGTGYIDSLDHAVK